MVWLIIYALMAFIVSILLRVIDLMNNGKEEDRTSGAYFACGVVWPVVIVMIILVFGIQIIEKLSNIIYGVIKKLSRSK